MEAFEALVTKRQLYSGLLLIMLFLTACVPSEEPVQEQGLSPLQITACETAETAGTCDTRLPEVGVVLAEDCCRVVGTCC